MEWVGQGTQHKSVGVGFLIKEGVSYREFEGGGEGWLPIDIMLDGKWVTIISVYLWQRAKKGLDARVENSLMLEEMGEFIQSRVRMGRGIVVIGDFNARIGESVGDEEGSRNQEGKELIEWAEARDLRILNGTPVAFGKWSWMAGERRSVIDYIMIGGALGEDDIIEMRVEDREGVDIPSDHKLIWAHIAGRGIKCDEGPQGGHRVAWDKVTPEQWEGFREILGTVCDRKVDVEALVGRDKVEKVWEDYVQGLDSTRGLFRKERVGRRNTKENKQFRDGLWGKKQELKRRKRDWERAVCDRQERGNVEVMEKYESYIQIRDEVNRMRDEEWRKRKSEYRLRVLGDGRGVEARFWKYRRSKRKRARTRVLKKKGGGLATSKTEIRWELEQHWRWLDQGVSIREGEEREGVPGGADREGPEMSR